MVELARSREGPVSVHLPGHVNAFASCSRTALCVSISLPVTGSRPPCRKRLGAGKKEALPSGTPYPGCCPSEPETCCLEPDGFWRIVWLVTSPVHEAGGVGISAASSPYGSYCPPFTMPRSRHQLGQEKKVAESQSLDAAGDSSLSRAICPGLPLLAGPPH